MQCERAPITRASGAATRQFCASQRRWVPGARGRQAKHREIQSGASHLLVGATRSSSHRPSPPRGSGRQKPITFSGTSKTRGEEKPIYSLFHHVQDAEPLASNDSPPPERGSNHRRGPSEEKGSPVPFGPRQRHVARKRAASTPLAARQAIKDKDTRVSATVSSPPRDDRWTPTNGVARVEPLKAPNKKRTDGQSRRRRRFFGGRNS